MADEVVVEDTPRGKAPPKKRRRVVISCTECHRRKQKCDRQLPCGNCKSRNKEAHCEYEPRVSSARDRETQSGREDNSPPDNNEPLSFAAAALGYSQTGPSTLSFIKKIESASTNEGDGEDAASGLSSRSSRQESFAIKEKFKGLIRLLPAKTYLDQLIDTFMAEFNWQYYFIDRQVFYKQLDEWNSLPFRILSSQGPEALPYDLRVFPALLFGMIAMALLALPEELYATFEPLKYAANMTFENLAMDYSESGGTLVGLFGKKTLSVTTVQAQFVRAVFLKYTAHVTESWHMIGVTIKDAQELGMHRDSLDPQPASSDAESVLENQWLIQQRRNIYMVLSIWDIHMCLILGRPGSLDWRHGLPTLPIDANIYTDHSKTPVIPRDEERDPPTPLSRTLHLQKMSSILRSVQDLEQDGPCPRDFSRVDKLHAKIWEIHETTPAIFRLDGADRRWDDHPGMEWIQPARFLLAQMHKFTLMALHRPYIFHRESSRNAALNASLEMLEIQRLAFAGLSMSSWRNYLMFYGNFDAATLIAAIYILFPHEHPELRDSAVQHLLWAVERFSAMRDRNPLARSAQGVLRAIVARVIKALGNCAPSASSTTTGYISEMSVSVSVSAESIALTPGGSLGNATSATMMGGDASSFSGVPMPTGDWLLTDEGHGLAGIAPMFPVGDILFNDLTANEDPALLPRLDMSDGLDPWHFGGAFGQNTLWQFLNQHPPDSNDSA